MAPQAVRKSNGRATVLVTGGAGYVGSVLVPRLLREGYAVKVLDLYLYGDHVLDAVKYDPNLQQVKGDLRDERVLHDVLAGCDSVIHLACISNDPSFELDPDLGRSINYDAFDPLVRIAKSSGVRRFIFASSASVYGISDAPNVTEEHPLNPLTDYSKYKGLCEPILLEQQSKDFTTVVVRPGTLCGYSPRQRLDLTVNILTTHAVTSGRITVFGGSQTRPSLHIQDVVDLYCGLLEYSDSVIAGQVYNVGHENVTVASVAEQVSEVVSRAIPGREEIEIVTTPTVDTRSYHISSEKLSRELGFVPSRGIGEAVEELCDAFRTGLLANVDSNVHYYNVKTMQAMNLK